MGEGDLTCPGFCFSTTYFSILDWRLANSSAPFPDTLVRVCSGRCSALGRVLELLRQDAHSGALAPFVFTSSLARKLEASAPRASNSSSDCGSGTGLSPCFFLSSAPCTRESSSGFGATICFSLNVNIDFLFALLAALSSSIPVLVGNTTFLSPAG